MTSAVLKGEAGNVRTWSASAPFCSTEARRISESMPAYFFVDIREIKDAAKMDEYRSRVAPTVETFGGRYLFRGGASEVVEGT